MPRTPCSFAPVLAGLLALTSAAALAGCGAARPPDPVRRSAAVGAGRSPTPTPHRTHTPTPGAGPTARPTAAPATTFPEAYAVGCAGRPAAEQVVALLRGTTGLLPAGAAVTVSMAPQCSGGWQYTVVSVPDREPLQVVTRGPPNALQLVTAGTNVCTIEVRTQAPRGILTLIECGAA
ncbi:MAG TPA: hypothetical protein VFM55_18670 [Micromonosporaceae bacterium]|nr:hypothetical protein [Micromonosporaceae bacterium]